MKIHFIAIGGSVMHNLAIALKKKGYQVSGSDDDVFEPSRSRLEDFGLLPESMGWHPDRITSDLDAVILGMHAHADNPELKKAKELGLSIYSYPEYIYQQSLEKQRVVVAGSHGKTTVTSIIIHVLNHKNRVFDFLVGANPSGIESTVKISKEAAYIIIEGDEYPSSRLDETPKCLHYHHHLGVVTGIAWDHVNIYKTFDDYCDQFRKFVELSEKAGVLIYNEDDKVLSKLIKQSEIRHDVFQIPYKQHKHKIKDGVTYLVNDEKELVEIKLFGEHNMYNIGAALEVCLKLGINKKEFYEAVPSFEGAARRMQKLGENEKMVIYQDFAHAPSKLQATTQAFKNQYPKRRLTACMELHTYSSLNKNFIDQYRSTMSDADEAIVYFNPKTVELKRLEPLSETDLQQAFHHKNLKVFSNSTDLENHLLNKQWENENLLLMTSGNFGNLDLQKISDQILHHFA